MPYRMFTPKAAGRLPLVVYLHGSGGLGTDNERQMGLGNVFGTRVWALPENQKEFPCFVLAPQTDRGWVRYGAPSAGDSVARVVPGVLFHALGEWTAGPIHFLRAFLELYAEVAFDEVA